MVLKALNGTTWVTFLSPPQNVTYRVVYINGLNDTGGTRKLWGEVLNGGTEYYNFEANAFNANRFINVSAAFHGFNPFNIEGPDDAFRLKLNGTGTPYISVHYEILENR